MSHGFDPGGGGRNHVAALSEPLASFASPYHDQQQQEEHHHHHNSNLVRSWATLQGQLSASEALNQSTQQQQDEPTLTATVTKPQPGHLQQSVAQQTYFSPTTTAASGATLGRQQRPPSRLLSPQSAPTVSVPTAHISHTMSLSASSLGGGGGGGIGHLGTYKSHSLLPNGHHPSQMGGLGTVTHTSASAVGAGPGTTASTTTMMMSSSSSSAAGGAGASVGGMAGGLVQQQQQQLLPHHHHLQHHHHPHHPPGMGMSSMTMAPAVPPSSSSMLLLPPPAHSVSRLSHSFMTTFPASAASSQSQTHSQSQQQQQLPPHHHHHHQQHYPNHTRQSSLLLNTDHNTTTQKDLSTTAPTSATGLTGVPSASTGLTASGSGGGGGGGALTAGGLTGEGGEAGGGAAGGASGGAIAINSSLLTSTYHHALSLLCMLSVLMCVLSASVLRPLESTDMSTERALRDMLSVCLLVLSMCLDLHCLFVCSLQLMLALREGSSAYLKRASCSRNLAVCSFLLSVPFFLTGVILLLDIPLPASLAIVGVVFLVCIASSLHNVYVWHLVVQSGEASSNAKALNGHIVQLSTLV